VPAVVMGGFDNPDAESSISVANTLMKRNMPLGSIFIVVNAFQMLTRNGAVDDTLQISDVLLILIP